ncbi:MAG: FHA domain-containing protein [Planctomycetota bacterium]
MPKVVITEGPGQGTEYKVDKAVILGRLETNDVPVRDAKASREHAKIFQQGQEFAIVDLNSSNGTFVNGQKVTKRVLKAGDEIAIGVVRLRFDLDAAEEPAPATPKRASPEEAFEKAQQKKDAPAAAAAAAGKPGDLVLKNFQPIQHRRIKPGKSLMGFDLEQMSDGARALLYVVLIAFFFLVIYLGYTLASG